MVRRLAALLVLGVAHHLLQPGEVLVEYAVVGLVVLAAHRLRQAVLLPLAAALTAVVGALASGPLVTPALFLLGMAVGRTDLPRRCEHHRVGYARAGAGVTAASLALLILVPTARGDARFDQWAGTAGLLMSGAYVCGLLLLQPTTAGAALERVLVPCGRMALTNYIAQTLLLLLLHVTVLRGAVSAPASLAAALGVLLVQVPASAWWLSRHPQGPLEWLWRRVTYGNLAARDAVR